jgi:hypothetical protein
VIGFINRPTFTPPVAPIALGTSGQVLTMVGGVPAFAAGGSSTGVTFGAYLSAALVGAGPFNDVSPAGFGTTTGRIDLANSGADCVVTGLVAGTDGQGIILRNADPTHNLTLANANAGSAAPNRFVISFDITLTPNGAVLLVYYTPFAGSGRWIVKT